MKLTRSEDGNAVDRYRHITPAPRGAPTCSARLPGGRGRRCTLRRGHAGPHVAHGWFGRVAAVWGKETTHEKTEARALRASGALARRREREEKGIGLWRGLRDRYLRRIPSMEEAIFLILALAFVGFAIHWLLLIFPLS